LPQTEIPAGEIWAGVPAKKIDLAEYRSSKEISDAS
jgi:hypothetical protein